MARATDLETRIRVLEDIEAIRKLKFKYWWSLDHKKWDEYADCFTHDFVYELNDNKIEGREPFVEIVKGFLTEDVTTSHHGHHSDIDIISDSTAKARWPLRDVLVNSKLNTTFKGRAFYEEEYRKDQGRWKMSSMKLSYIFATGDGIKYGKKTALMLALLGDTETY